MPKYTYVDKDFSNQTISNVQGLSGGSSNQVYEVADITARDAIASPNTADIAKVADDGTSNPRDYVWNGTTWIAFVAGSGGGGGSNSTAVKVIDTFTDPDGTLITAHASDLDTSGSAWEEIVQLSITTLIPNSITIQSNRWQSSNDSHGSVKDLGVADAILSASWIPQSGVFNRNSLIARYIDADNLIIANFREDNGDFQIVEIVDGVSTTLANKSVSILEGEIYSISFKVLGGLLEATLTQQDVSTIVNDTITAITSENLNGTKHGLCRNTGDSSTIVDSFSLIGIGGGSSNANAIAVAATPTNYNPAAANVEDHLSAIDLVLASGGGSFTTIEETYQHSTAFAVTGSTNNVVTFNTAIQTETLFDKSTGAILQNGIYLIEFSCQIRNPGVALNQAIKELSLDILVNGLSVCSGGTQSWNNSGFNGAGSSVSLTKTLTTSDILSFNAFIWDNSEANSYSLEANSHKSQLRLVFLGIGGGRELLTSDRTYFVSPTGSDTNDGLTSGTPFLTIQKAIDVVAGLDLTVYNVTIQIEDGIFLLNNSLELKPIIGTGIVTLQGNQNDKNAVILKTDFNSSFQAIIFNYSKARYDIQDLTIENTNFVANIRGISSVIDGTETFVKNIKYGQNITTCLQAERGYIKILGEQEITNSQRYEFIASVWGKVEFDFTTVNLIFSGGTVDFSTAFVFAWRTGGILLHVALNVSGSASGQKYFCLNGGWCDVNGNGQNAFPGSASGSVNQGYYYS